MDQQEDKIWDFPLFPQLVKRSCLVFECFIILILQVRDVLAETTMAEDAAPLRIPAMKAKETAMDLEMEARMMVTEAASRGWFVAPTTARSLASTFMRRTTAVRGQEEEEAKDPSLASPCLVASPPNGLPGAALDPVVRSVDWARWSGQGHVLDLSVGSPITPRMCRRGRVRDRTATVDPVILNQIIPIIHHSQIIPAIMIILGKIGPYLDTQKRHCYAATTAIYRYMTS